MSSEVVICVKNVGKNYHIYNQPHDRLKQFLFRGKREYFREFWALKEVGFEVRKGEVVGVVGDNGAGKSTLLQLICGTLTPSQGVVEINGRIAALLELGAGFNPECSGSENIWMNATILGLTKDEIRLCYDEIVKFSGIGDFISQPVKTYSSGMYIRLAFSIAINVKPDILVIDEALSVGDGEFARKSFDRIMEMKDEGKTIFLCSHSMYQIDALCERALWLDKGQVRMFDKTALVTSAYNRHLDLKSGIDSCDKREQLFVGATLDKSVSLSSTGAIINIFGYCDNFKGSNLHVKSLKSTVSVRVEFLIGLSLPKPTIGLGLENAAGISVSSVISDEDVVFVNEKGRGYATIIFPQIPLLKGKYRVSVFLACEKALHVYDSALHCLTLNVAQDGLHQGMVLLPHYWKNIEEK